MPKTGGLFGKKSEDSIAQMKEQMAEKLKNESQEPQKQDEDKPLETAATNQDEAYTEADMYRVWHEFIAQLNKGSLSFMKERKLNNINHKISVIFASNHERSLCEEHRLNALQYFRINLKNTQINLDFEVDATLIPETKSLSVEDKFNKMVEQNPDLATLRQLLELEIEY
jgi:hypothetical protein